jgi:hypothetical protein
VTINVALVAPGVLGDLIVSVIERDPEFHLIVRAEDAISVVRLCGDSELHAVVLTTPTGPIPPAAGRLLRGGACRALVAITPDGKEAWLHSATGDPQPLCDLSPDRLLTVIRDAVAASGEATDD